MCVFFLDFCFCLFARPRKKEYRDFEFFFWSHNTTKRTNNDPGFQPERRPSDGESDHVDVRFLLRFLLLLRLLLLLARRLTSCFFFRFETWDACEYFRALLILSLSLSLSLSLRYATTTLTTLTTQGRPRDVRETRVPVPERKDERSRATKSGLRDDVSSRRMHVRVDSFLVSLASTFSLPFFFLSLERARAVHATTCVRRMVCVCLCGVY